MLTLQLVFPTRKKDSPKRLARIRSKAAIPFERHSSEQLANTVSLTTGIAY